jgi:hypothetical protein
MCPCTKFAHMHVVFTPSLFPISPFCCRSLSRFEKVPQERYKSCTPVVVPRAAVQTVLAEAPSAGAGGTEVGSAAGEGAGGLAAGLSYRKRHPRACTGL